MISITGYHEVINIMFPVGFFPNRVNIDVAVSYGTYLPFMYAERVLEARKTLRLLLCFQVPCRSSSENHCLGLMRPQFSRLAARPTTDGDFDKNPFFPFDFFLRPFSPNVSQKSVEICFLPFLGKIPSPCEEHSLYLIFTCNVPNFWTMVGFAGLNLSYCFAYLYQFARWKRGWSWWWDRESRSSVSRICVVLSRYHYVFSVENAMQELIGLA